LNIKHYNFQGERNTHFDENHFVKKHNNDQKNKWENTSLNIPMAFGMIPLNPKSCGGEAPEVLGDERKD